MKVLAMVKNGDFENKIPGELELQERPIPEVGDEDVLIKIKYSAICGSDPHIVSGMLDPTLPMDMGHEVSGIVDKLGPNATKKGLKVGDRVTGNFVRFCGTCYLCRNGQENLCAATWGKWDGCQAEYVLWHESQVYKIPDDVDSIDASLTEPTAIALHLVESANIRIGNRVAVVGGGGIGQLSAQIARISGASSVTLFEPVEQKREVALSVGIDYAYDNTKEGLQEIVDGITDGRGFDNVIETSGNPKAAEQALKMTAMGGHVVYPAMFNADYNLPVNLWNDCYMMEKHIHGSLMSPYSFPRTVQLLRRLQLKPLIQKVYKLEDYKQAYDDAISRTHIKIVFDLTDN